MHERVRCLSPLAPSEKYVSRGGIGVTGESEVGEQEWFETSLSTRSTGSVNFLQRAPPSCCPIVVWLKIARKVFQLRRRAWRISR